MTSKRKEFSADHRAKLSEGQKRRFLDPEARAKIGHSLKGRRHSPEARVRMSEAQKKRFLDLGARNKMSEAIKKRELRGSKSSRWKSGRVKDRNGYINLWAPDHIRANCKGYIMEHTLAWEQAHGRPLPDNYVVHHINGIRDDNRPENLLACPRGNHHYALLLQGLQSRIRQLEAQVLGLKAQRRLWETESSSSSVS